MNLWFGFFPTTWASILNFCFQLTEHHQEKYGNLILECRLAILAESKSALE